MSNLLDIALISLKLAQGSPRTYIGLVGPPYRHRHAHKHLCTVLPLYSKIQVIPGITSCRLMKDNNQDLIVLLKKT